MDANLRSLLDHHRAFWTMDQTGVPLEHIGEYRPMSLGTPFRLADGSPVTEGTVLSKADLDPEVHAPLEGGPESAVSGGFMTGSGVGGLCWTEGVAGCPVLWRSGSVWSDSFLDAAAAANWHQQAAASPWLEKLLSFAERAVRRAAGRHPVTQPLLRGPIDIAAAALGDEELCWMLTDQPEAFSRFLSECTDVFIAVSTAWVKATPAFHGGYTLYGIWAPGTVVRSQCDNAALLSPQVYAEMLAPCDERICEHFDYPLIHTHSCFIEIAADALLGVQGLACIQVSLDYPGGPSVAQLLPTLQKINQQKPMVLTGPVTPDELRVLRKDLSPRGLSLQVSLLPEG